MILEVKKEERETAQSLIRRFTKRVQKSGILLKARESRFYQRSKSRQMKKKEALRRERLKQEYKKLEKLGKIEKY